MSEALSRAPLRTTAPHSLVEPNPKVSSSFVQLAAGHESRHYLVEKSLALQIIAVPKDCCKVA